MGIVSPVSNLNNKCCINLMLSESEALGKVAPSLETRDAGGLRALYSPSNGGTMVVIDDGKERPYASSSRKVKVKYTTKDCTTGTTTRIDRCNLSTNAAPDPFKFADVEITGVYNWEFQLTDALLLTMCENRVDFYNTVLKNKLDAAIQGLNAAYLAQLIPKMGKYPITGDESLVTPVILPVVTTAGVANPAGMALMKTYYQQMNQSGDIISVGAGKMDYLANALSFSGLSNNGIDGSKFALKNFFRDANVNTSPQFSGSGTDNLLTWLAGAVRPVEFFQNGGDFVETGPEITVGGKKYHEYEFGRVELGGVVWDLFMTRTCGVWNFVFQKEFEVVPLPADAFAACQPYNYALAFLLGCGDLTCDMINAATVPAEEES